MLVSLKFISPAQMSPMTFGLVYVQLSIQHLHLDV